MDRRHDLQVARHAQQGVCVMMDNKVSGRLEPDEDILSFDVADDALERAAAVADGRVITVAYCTQDWLSCGWPL